MGLGMAVQLCRAYFFFFFFLLQRFRSLWSSLTAPLVIRNGILCTLAFALFLSSSCCLCCGGVFGGESYLGLQHL